jgi:hypothetical protein
MRKTLLTQSESAPLSDLWFDAVPLHNPLDPMLSGRSAATDMRRPNCQLVIDAHGDLSNHVIVRLEDSTGATSSLAHLPDDYHERPNAKIIYMPKGYPLGAMMIGDDDAPIMWLCATIQDAWAIHRSSTMPTFCAVYFTDSNRAHIINAYAQKRRMAYCIDSVERESQQQPTAKTPVIDQRFVQLVDVSARPAMAIEFGEDIGKLIDQVIYAADMARAELPRAPTTGAPPAFGAWTPDLMLERVSLIYGTDTVWDDINRIQIKLSHLRYATGKMLYDGWIDNPQRRIVKGLVFDPAEQQIDRYTINLFNGLPAQAYNAKASCERILAHMLRLCGGRGAEFDWLIKWIAYPLQHLGAKMDTGVIMYGSEGPGKSILWEHVVGSIYGKYSTTIGQSQLESQFTAWQSGKLFALCEEVVGRTERNQHKGQLKHLVTGRTVMINDKGMPLREESNHLNFVFLSNSTIPLELDMGDRRYMVLYCGDVPDKKYFDQLFNEIDNGGVAAFYHHLMRVDLGDFNSHAKPPLNVDKQQLIEASLPNPVLFYNDWLAGDLDIPFTSCTKSDLFTAYRRWCTQRNEYPKRDRDLTAELRRYMTDTRTTLTCPAIALGAKTYRIWITNADKQHMATIPNANQWLQSRVNTFRLSSKTDDHLSDAL